MINTDVIVGHGGKEGGSASGFSTGDSGIRVGGGVCVNLVLLVMVEAIVIMFSLMVIMVVMVVLW